MRDEGHNKLKPGPVCLNSQIVWELIKTETQKCLGLDKVSTCHFLQIKNTKGVFRVRQKQPPKGIGEGKVAETAGPGRLVSRADGTDQLHTP